MKIPLSGPELFHTNRLTDRYDEATSRVLEFYKSAIDLPNGAFTKDDEKRGN